MLLKNKIFHAFEYVRHRLTARNTLGYGVHSPYLFYITRALFPETASYYCFRAIEARRAAMMTSHEMVDVQDFGTGSSGRRRVSDIAATSLKPAREAQLLMRLAVLQDAKEIVELGTNLGITSAYLASAGTGCRVTTFEGAERLVDIARDNWKKLGLNNLECVVGNIDNTLAEYQPTQSVDLAFFDANHTGEATRRYFAQLLPHFNKNTIAVIDDIHASRDMLAAWHELCGAEGVTASIDLFSMGLLFFDPFLQKKTYVVRLT